MQRLLLLLPLCLAVLSGGSSAAVSKSGSRSTTPAITPSPTPSRSIPTPLPAPSRNTLLVPTLVCGNGLCEAAHEHYGEACGNCPYDCGPCQVSQELTQCKDDMTYALSFDDGPSEVTLSLLPLLAAAGVKANFFLTASRLVMFPRVLEAILKAQHAVYSHSFQHPDLTALSPADLFTELSSSTAAFQAHTCVQPTLYRAPYGALNDGVHSVTSRLGLRAVGWNLDTLDWLFAATDPIEMVVEFRANLDLLAPVGVLQQQQDLFQPNVDVTPELMSIVKEKGYKFVSVDECAWGPAYQLNPSWAFANRECSVEWAAIATRYRNGTECPLTEWSEWSTCDAECGVGSSTRVRLTLPPAAAYKNVACFSAELIQRAPCDTLVKCPQYVWDDRITDTDGSGNELSTFEMQYLPLTTCVFSDWQWRNTSAACSSPCGQGVQHMVRNYKGLGVYSSLCGPLVMTHLCELRRCTPLDKYHWFTPAVMDKVHMAIGIGAGIVLLAAACAFVGYLCTRNDEAEPNPTPHAKPRPRPSITVWKQERSHDGGETSHTWDSDTHRTEAQFHNSNQHHHSSSHHSSHNHNSGSAPHNTISGDGNGDRYRSGSPGLDDSLQYAWEEQHRSEHYSSPSHAIHRSPSPHAHHTLSDPRPPLHGHAAVPLPGTSSRESQPQQPRHASASDPLAPHPIEHPSPQLLPLSPRTKGEDRSVGSHPPSQVSSQHASTPASATSSRHSGDPLYQKLPLEYFANTRTNGTFVLRSCNHNPHQDAQRLARIAEQLQHLKEHMGEGRTDVAATGSAESADSVPKAEAQAGTSPQRLGNPKPGPTAALGKDPLPTVYGSRSRAFDPSVPLPWESSPRAKQDPRLDPWRDVAVENDVDGPFTRPVFAKRKKFRRVPKSVPDANPGVRAPWGSNARASPHKRVLRSRRSAPTGTSLRAPVPPDQTPSFVPERFTSAQYEQPDAGMFHMAVYPRSFIRADEV